ncbi:GNAT family protein [Archangium sp.]|uniref:GNAT family N-acetyltransferase n=1 Tax=Archangium sp. TaxID=1872627 RepID=UPI00286A0E54|nr:GNAT family protein [Archangium sp.]
MLTLREMNEVDLPIFFEYQQEPDAKRMAAFPEIEREAFMTHWREHVLGNAGVQKKTIVIDNKVAGNVVSWEQSGQRLVGYWVGQDYWGRGIATAALLEFLKYETTRPLYAYVTVRNLGSIRVLEKGGFRPVAEHAKGSDGNEEHVFRLDG